MAKLWLNISRVFLLAIFSFMIFAASPVSAAGFALFGTSEEPDVSFEATDVTLDGDKVTIKGNFKNHTDNFQRVIGYTMKYMFYDEDGVILIDGAFKGENFSIEVGKDLVPYSVTVDNKDALIKDVAHEAYGWKVQSSVKTEK